MEGSEGEKSDGGVSTVERNIDGGMRRGKRDGRMKREKECWWGEKEERWWDEKGDVCNKGRTGNIIIFAWLNYP